MEIDGHNEDNRAPPPLPNFYCLEFIYEGQLCKIITMAFNEIFKPYVYKNDKVPSLSVMLTNSLNH